MQADLQANSEKYNFLGASRWNASSEEAAGNSVMHVIYFHTLEGLRTFSHDTIHREAWNWWNGIVGKNPHLAIWHELYVAPKGHWENIYINTKPLLIGATSFPVKTEEGKKWISPVVFAGKGMLKSSRGRMTLESK
jgi:hypothetical protein